MALVRARQHLREPKFRAKRLGFHREEEERAEAAMEAYGGFMIDEKAVRVENAFLDFLKRFSSSSLSSCSFFFHV